MWGVTGTDERYLRYLQSVLDGYSSEIFLCRTGTNPYLRYLRYFLKGCLRDPAREGSHVPINGIYRSFFKGIVLKKVLVMGEDCYLRYLQYFLKGCFLWREGSLVPINGIYVIYSLFWKGIVLKFCCVGLVPTPIYGIYATSHVKTIPYLSYTIQ